jgi:NADP-dependent 3-hydroxy acid dehydrogenase YdfG
LSKNIAIVGFGPGTASAVAEKFGGEGFTIAIIGRSEERLANGVSHLASRGIIAYAFPADAANAASLGNAIKSIRAKIGPITVLHWNAYGGLEAGDLLTASRAAVQNGFDVAVFGLLAAVDEALPDLRASGDGAVLISNGAFGEASTQMDELAAGQRLMGLALSSAAKHKLVGLLAARLKSQGVYVGEVMVHGPIKGTPAAPDKAIDPAVIAAKHWAIYQSRSETRASVTFTDDI